MQLVKIYQSKEGVPVNIFYQDDHLWMPMLQVSQVLGVTKQNVLYHIQNLEQLNQFQEGKHFVTLSITRREGTREVTRQIRHYSEWAVIRIGFRVNSERALAFQEWAAETLVKLHREGVVRVDGVLPGSRAELAEVHHLLDTLGVPKLDSAAQRVAYLAGAEKGLPRCTGQNDAQKWLARLNQMVADGTAYLLPAEGAVPVTVQAPWFIGWIYHGLVCLHIKSARKAVPWRHSNQVFYRQLKQAGCLGKVASDRPTIRIRLKKGGRRVRAVAIAQAHFSPPARLSPPNPPCLPEGAAG